jgi:hypothetical protein
LVKTIGRSFWVLAHLEHDHVFYAFVTQVLTGSQLSKTYLPAERWTVTPLGQDRHLVRHTQPEMWFDTSPPRFDQGGTRIQAVPQDVLDQAREDFGAAIMTAQTLEEHPPPLPNKEQIRALGLLRLTPR